LNVVRQANQHGGHLPLVSMVQLWMRRLED